MTNEQTSLEKYTSHTLFLKGLRKGWCWLCVRDELETRIDCYILTQSSSDHSNTSSSFCWAAQPGSWGTKPTVWRWLPLRHLVSNCDWNSNCDCNSNWTLPASNPNWLKPSVAPGYIIFLPSTCFLLAYGSAPNSTTSTGQGDTPISSTGCTCYLHRCIS